MLPNFSSKHSYESRVAGRENMQTDHQWKVVSICIVEFCFLPVRRTWRPERGVSSLSSSLLVDPAVVNVTNELSCRVALVGKALLANQCAYYDETT